MIEYLWESLVNTWESIKEDPVATLVPVGTGALMAGSMASGFGFVWGSLLTHTGIASIIGAGGYSLYEISHGEKTKGLTDLLKVAFSAITLGQNMQVTINGGGNSGGMVSNSGAFVLNGSGELSFAFSGEVTFEQGLVVIQGIAGNPSGGSSTGNVEEKSQNEENKDTPKAIYNGEEKEIKYGSSVKSESKLNNQMKKRGWTKELIQETIDNSYTTRESTNLATGNKATVYYNQDGSYVIIDNITKEIVQISDKFDLDWIPDPNIINPYRP